MSRRWVLKGAIAGLVLIGLALVAVPFVRAMGAGPKAVASAPHIDIAGMEPGDFRFVGVPEKLSDRILLIRDYDGQLSVLALPMQDETHVRLPDVGVLASGFYLGPTCRDFGPDMADRKIAPRGSLRCKDEVGAELPAGLERGHWSYAGKNLFNKTPDLIHWQFHLENNFVVLERPIVPDDYWTRRD